MNFRSPDQTTNQPDNATKPLKQKLQESQLSVIAGGYKIRYINDDGHKVVEKYNRWGELIKVTIRL